MNGTVNLKNGVWRRIHSPGAFSLLETLVALSVLAVIVVMMAQVISNATLATGMAVKKIDSDTQVRCLFDRIEADLNSAIKRSDVDFYLKHDLPVDPSSPANPNNTWNDSIYFFSEVDGYYSSGDPAMVGLGRLAARNTAALIGYRVSDRISGGTRFGLERLSRGLHWADVNPQGDDPLGGPYTSVPFLPLGITGCFGNSLTDSSNNTLNLRSQWDVIADQVFRFELSFLITDGTNLTISKNPYASNHTAANWRTDVVAIIVTVAAVEQRSRLLLNNISALSGIVTLLADADDSQANLADTWTQAIRTNMNNPPPGVPKSVMSAVRVYQRYYYINGRSVPN